MKERNVKVFTVDGGSEMTITDLLPRIQDLPRADKLRLVQFLVSELAKEEGVSMLAGNISYPVWTPYDAFEAAETLLGALKADKASDNG